MQCTCDWCEGVNFRPTGCTRRALTKCVLCFLCLSCFLPLSFSLSLSSYQNSLEYVYVGIGACNVSGSSGSLCSPGITQRWAHRYMCTMQCNKCKFILSICQKEALKCVSSAGWIFKWLKMDSISSEYSAHISTLPHLLYYNPLEMSRPSFLSLTLQVE